MAARERYSVEQIIAKLVEAEKLQGQGLTIPQACKRLQISDQTSTAVLIEASACAHRSNMRKTVERVRSESPLPHRKWTSRSPSRVSRSEKRRTLLGEPPY